MFFEVWLNLHHKRNVISKTRVVRRFTGRRVTHIDAFSASARTQRFSLFVRQRTLFFCVRCRRENFKGKSKNAERERERERERGEGETERKRKRVEESYC